jgi:invasion protein IalB
LLLAILWVSPATAQFVDYYSVHGDWTVTCARDMLTNRAACTFGAPTQRLGQAPAATVTVTAPAGSPPVVGFRLPGVVDAAKTVGATVDSGSTVAAKANRYGEGRWDGVAAAGLIESMRVGDQLALTWWPEGETAPRTAIFGLLGFGAALEDYRRRLAATGAAPSR